MSGRRLFRPGDLVEVRSLEEILGTLDEDGKYEGVPFMPEMAAYCGRRYVFERTADRTCEEGTGGMRRLPNAVFLADVRCDGSAHDGCERGCLIFWKTAWLKTSGQPPTGPSGRVRSLAELQTRVGDRYVCQSTELASASVPMSAWDIRPLVGDLVNREVSLRMFVRVISLTLWNKLVTLAGSGRGITRLRGTAARTSAERLELRAGDRVQVKRREDIVDTLDEEGRNRGLSFEYDMIPYCGGTYDVAFPVEKIILEESGKMITIANTVALDGVVCEGLLRRSCPRRNLLFWREAWLTRTDPTAETGGDSETR